MEFKSLVKNTSYMAVTRIAQFFAGLITTKLSAILLGTVGVGVVNQLYFITQKMSQFTTLSMVEAVVKQISENRNKDNAAELIKSSFKSYIVLVSFFFILSFFILLVFANIITTYIFGDIIYLNYFFVGLITFPLLIVSSIPFAILRAFLDVKSIARARLGIVVVNLVIAIPLIFFFKLNGAIASVSISYIVELLFHYFYARKKYFRTYNINLKKILNSTFNLLFIKELFLFSGFGITIGTYAIVSEFVCRSIVVSNLGVDKIGLYSPIITFAGIFTGFLLPSLSTYLYPRFCELKTDLDISGLLNDSLRLGTLMMIPLLLLGIPFAEIIIKIFYSKDFLESIVYLPYHFIGILFYVWWFVFTQAMTPTGRIKQHGFFQLLFYSTDIVVTYIFVYHFGLWGWMLKHIISPFIFFWVYSIYSNKKMGFKLTKENRKLMLYTLISTIVIIAINKSLENGYIVNYFLGPLMVLIVFRILEKSEKHFIRLKLIEVKNRILNQHSRKDV